MKKIIILCAFFMIVGFLLCGEQLDQFFNFQNFVKTYENQKIIGGTIGFFLLIADIFLPTPATGIITGFGKLFGVFCGGLLGFLGMFFSGVIAYFLSRFFSKRYIKQNDLEKTKPFFEKCGGFSIILTRFIPIVAELFIILAGITKMNFAKFVSALIIGILPLTFFWAWLGTLSKQENTNLPMMISLLLPVIFTVIYVIVLKLRSKK